MKVQATDRQGGRVGERIGGGVVFVLGYVLLALATLWTDSLEGIQLTRLVWLPSGLALAFIVQAGLRAWPWIFAAEALVTVFSGDPIAGALGTGAGSTAEAVLAASLLSTIGFSASLSRWRDVVALIVLASGLSSLLGAVVSVSSLVWSGTFAVDAFWSVTFRWWLTHANGILVVTPVALVFYAGLGARVRARPGEALLIGGLLLTVGAMLFGSPDPRGPGLFFLYLPFPILLWAAFRFQVPGAALANLFLLVPALVGTALGRGPLVGEGTTLTLVLFSVFLVVVVLTSLILAGVVQDREEVAGARLAAEEERRIMGERMHQAQKLESLGVLAGGIAHDFNNLLATIMGNADLVERRLPVDDPAGDHVAEVLRASRHAADLCRQILAYAGRGKVSAGVVDLNDVVTEMGELLGVSFPKDAEVKILPAAEVPPVWGDVTQIRQVVLNLLTNAADALPEGRGRINVRTGTMTSSEIVEADVVSGDSPLPRGTLVHLTVEDDGPGMDEDLRVRIFEPFFSTKQVGRGLGLSVVLGIVRSHGGCMELRTSPGEGARFRMTLPVTERAGTLAQPVRTVEDGASLAGTVLVADDDRAVRGVCRAMLEEMGLRVLEAADGQEAVDVYRDRIEEIDLAMLDITMPRMDGFQAMMAIRKMDPGARVLLSTGNVEPAEEVEAVWGVPLLPKPYGSRELRDTIAGLLTPVEPVETQGP
jgi:signal transduction histidine kinase/CheY-like chemotaxis protein